MKRSTRTTWTIRSCSALASGSIRPQMVKGPPYSSCSRTHDRTYDVKKKNVFVSPRYSPIGLQLFFENVSQDTAFAESSTKDSGPTAVGVKRMDTGDLQVCLAVSSWRLDAGALWRTCESQHGQGTRGNGVPGLNS